MWRSSALPRPATRAFFFFIFLRRSSKLLSDILREHRTHPRLPAFYFFIFRGFSVYRLDLRVF